MNIEKYFKDIETQTKLVYEWAEEARKKGLDPVDKVEILLAESLAEKAVGLISMMYPQLIDSGIVERISELEKEYGKLDPAVSFKIAEEIAKQKFCKFSSLLESITAGVRVGFAIQHWVLFLHLSKDLQNWLWKRQKMGKIILWCIFQDQ